METRYLPDSVRYQTMTSEELRKAFLIDPFEVGRLQLTAFDVDRAVVGAAVPTTKPLLLPGAAELRAEYFCERRELGALNVGGAGRIRADGATFDLGPRDCLYLGRGTREISFESEKADDPAAFFLVSFPAHTTYPATLARMADARAIPLGTVEQANKRTIYQYIHPQGIRSCQLVMGFTELEPGSVWNTMPPHSHERRCEIYMYFDLGQDRVFHLMGKPDETRHILMSNRQAVFSPSWSVHSGTGTSRYRFIWAMGGENQAFDDMDGVSLDRLR